MKIYNEIMVDFLEHYNPQIVAEIGVLAGNMSNRLLTNIQSINTLYMIDPWFEYNKINQENSKDKRLLAYEQQTWDDMYSRAQKIAEKHGNRATIMRMTSIEASTLFEDCSIETAIIDADHSYLPVIKDCLVWIPKIKNGYPIIGHDYSSGWQDVVHAVNDIFGLENINRLNGGYWYVDLEANKKEIYINKCKELLGE